MYFKNWKSFWPLLAAILVVAAGAVYFWKFYKKYVPTEQLYTITRAPKGEIVTGFPQDLLVEKNPVVEDSYSLAYSAGNLNQPVVTYVSNWPMVQNVAQFGAYLRNNGWTITHEADPFAKNTFYYASKDNNDANITLSTEAEKVRVTISYVKR